MAAYAMAPERVSIREDARMMDGRAGRQHVARAAGVQVPGEGVNCDTLRGGASSG